MSRLFIAVKISPEAKKEAEKAQNELKKMFGHSRIAWVSGEAMHLTLHFLGDCAEKQIPRIKEAMTVVGGAKPRLTLKEVGAFPYFQDPRILIIRVVDESGHLARVQSELGKKLAEAGFIIDIRPFKTHITLGRVKFLKDRVEKLDIPVSPISWDVFSVELMESKLTPDGPEYTELASFEL